MEKRNVNVHNIRATSVAFSSILSIGDSNYARPKSRGIAIQKEGAIFTKTDKVEFENYDIFSRKATWPNTISPVTQCTYHQEGNINVQFVSFTGLSTSSICQVGSIDKIVAEARVKHFRVLREENSNSAQNP